MNGEQLLELEILLAKHVVPDTIPNMARQAVNDRAELLRQRHELQIENTWLKLRAEIFQKM